MTISLICSIAVLTLAGVGVCALVCDFIGGILEWFKS